MNLLKDPIIVGPKLDSVIRLIAKQAGQDFHGNLWEAIAREPYARFARMPVEEVRSVD